MCSKIVDTYFGTSVVFFRCNDFSIAYFSSEIIFLFFDNLFFKCNIPFKNKEKKLLNVKNKL